MPYVLLTELRALEEPRIAGMVRYPLDEIVFVVLVGFLCKIDDIDDIEDFGNQQHIWLRQFCRFQQGLPPLKRPGVFW